MLTISSPEIIALIGFFGGIFGGLFVNFVTMKLQKREDRIAEDEKIKREFSKQVKSIINEIIESWDKESSKKYIDQQRIKNDFDIFSCQLTSLIASAPAEFPSEILSQLRELSISLKKLDDIPIGIGQDLISRFYYQIEQTIELTKKIQENFSNF